MSDALLSCCQDPKMFRAVQMVYFVTPVIGGMWIMNQVCVLPVAWDVLNAFPRSKRNTSARTASASPRCRASGCAP